MLTRVRSGGTAISDLAGQKLAGLGIGFGNLRRRARGDDLTAMHSGARAEVHDPIRGMHGFFVVLDHQHGVAEIAQLGERVEQLAVVALVQADRWLVQDIHHADQPGADLRGQPDALGLATRKRRRRAIERQVVQAHVEQEAEPVADFFQNFAGHGQLIIAQTLGLRHAVQRFRIDLPVPAVGGA